MALDKKALAAAKRFTSDTADSLGALKGAPCTIKSITEVDGGQKVTFEWTGNSGTKQTSEMTVKNGVSVTGISDKGNGVFTLLLSDGSESDEIQTLKGEKGLKGEPGVSPTITENADNTDKIYKLDIETVDGKFTTPNLKGADGQGGTGGSGTAEDTTYTNENFPQYDNVDLALDALFNKVYYVKPTCSLSATPSGGTFEMGTAISAPITFTWTTNKDITSQTLTGCTLANASVRTATYNTNVTSDKSFTLSVSDGENSASSSVSYKFLNKVYYGSASEPDSYDSAFILGLANNKFATSIKGSYPITVESGQFGYIACPKSFNAPSECYIGGFLTTLENAGEISFTNASGGVATYTILRTGKSGLGSLTMEFK